MRDPPPKLPRVLFNLDEVSHHNTLPLATMGAGTPNTQPPIVHAQAPARGGDQWWNVGLPLLNLPFPWLRVAEWKGERVVGSVPIEWELDCQEPMPGRWGGGRSWHQLHIS